jgi:predicted nucleotidyltransferase
LVSERGGIHRREAALTLGVDQRSDIDNVVYVAHDLTYRVVEALAKALVHIVHAEIAASHKRLIGSRRQVAAPRQVR